jgi:hypothetical protein
MELVTLEAFKSLSPLAQGYVSYMEAELPESELKDHQHNPYTYGSVEHDEFHAGQMQAMLNVQDGEE